MDGEWLASRREWMKTVANVLLISVAPSQSHHSLPCYTAFTAEFDIFLSLFFLSFRGGPLPWRAVARCARAVYSSYFSLLLALLYVILLASTRYYILGPRRILEESSKSQRSVMLLSGSSASA